MDISLALAVAHHLAVFTLVGLFAAEFTLLRPGLSGARIEQLGKIDLAYGIVAGLVVVVGVVRVLFGEGSWEYYATNHAFWAKMAAFVVMGLLTIPPTLAIRGWIKGARDDALYVVPLAEIATNRRYVHLQAGFLLLIPGFAAAMARGYGS